MNSHSLYAFNKKKTKTKQNVDIKFSAHNAFLE